MSAMPYVFCCTRQSSLAEVLGVEDDGLFASAVHPPDMLHLRGKTLELMPLQELFTQPLSYKGVMNLFMFSQQLAVVKAQSFGAFSDA